MNERKPNRVKEKDKMKKRIQSAHKHVQRYQ